MHSMAYQLRSLESDWIQNKVDRGAGVCRTFHVAIAQSHRGPCDADDQLRCCARDGIIAEGMMRSIRYSSRSYEMSRLDVRLCARSIFQVKVSHGGQKVDQVSGPNDRAGQVVQH
jgi:hypothetical protein